MREIKCWNNGKIIHSGDFESIKDCLENGVKKGISFAYADLTYADLTYADLTRADLTYADLTYADLTRADLTYADLTNVILIEADLTGANLNGARLTYAGLNGANLNGARLNGARLDFSAWPLWCGSIEATVDDRLSKQLAYHAICVMSDGQKIAFLKDPIAWANAFHQVGSVPRIEQPKRGQDERD
jgi:uncharacterized protein YjbI with pentapeptide repeats